ncbi:MAG: hypothetical protein DMG81_10750 [Acidobacteria bacterium]|nr:MAG: hypothetical protein DMG81_10750 [Acidobacteriota bacterium]
MPAKSAGGASAAACGSPLSGWARPLTSGGGATAEFKAPRGDCERDVAESGTEGMVGFEDARLGARGPSASFKSGGTTSLGVPRLSAATGMAPEPCARDAVCDFVWDCGLAFGGLLRAEGNIFEGE